eukprot:TRINITY_DN22179_c0_g1_i3.p1 TRINITY_DN22179_c0_g1~~TRINITY_DN22179_c0_g1_i3.p1  ORF type:complete len:217 (+),score=38.21 TRINITY_DN22179_c0_g1_i3:91-741(+)
MLRSLVGSEMCIRDRHGNGLIMKVYPEQDSTPACCQHQFEVVGWGQPSWSNKLGACCGALTSFTEFKVRDQSTGEGWTIGPIGRHHYAKLNKGLTEAKLFPPDLSRKPGRPPEKAAEWINRLLADPEVSGHHRMLEFLEIGPLGPTGWSLSFHESCKFTVKEGYVRRQINSGFRENCLRVCRKGCWLLLGVLVWGLVLAASFGLIYGFYYLSLIHI